MVVNIKTYEVVLSGRVQGVGFRYFVESIAGKYDICGYVRNTYNNQVEIICQGEEEDIENFIDEVKKGPTFSAVTDIKIDEIENSKKYSIFEIKY
jgi:acylphosphatase